MTLCRRDWGTTKARLYRAVQAGKRAEPWDMGAEGVGRRTGLGRGLALESPQLETSALGPAEEIQTWSWAALVIWGNNKIVPGICQHQNPIPPGQGLHYPTPSPTRLTPAAIGPSRHMRKWWPWHQEKGGKAAQVVIAMPLALLVILRLFLQFSCFHFLLLNAK